MSVKKPINPFYPPVIVAGVVFALTACMYGVMTVRMLNPQGGEDTGVLQFMDQHGMTVMIVELVVLGLLTFAAIGTDDYWTRRAEQKEQGAKNP